MEELITSLDQTLASLIDFENEVLLSEIGAIKKAYKNDEESLMINLDGFVKRLSPIITSINDHKEEIQVMWKARKAKKSQAGVDA